VGYTRFVYAGDHVAYETDEAGTIGRTYLWGVGTDHLVGVREANGTYYVAVTDKLGSVRALVRRSDGVWTGSMRYDPYGSLIDSAGSTLGIRYRWTGREWDAETGFYFHRARYYDPGAKRFVSEDPIGYAGGDNLYGYVGGAVLEARDPSGLFVATLYPRGFMAMCTTMGSCMDWTGSVTRDDYSAVEALIDWGAASYAEYLMRQAIKGGYENYVANYDKLKQKYGSDPRYKELFAGSRALNKTEYDKIGAAVLQHLSGAPREARAMFGALVIARLVIGEIFVNDLYVAGVALKAGEAGSGHLAYTQPGSRFTVFDSRVLARVHSPLMLANNLVHEAIHAYYYDTVGGNECETYRWADQVTGYVSWNTSYACKR
jgi:RHS repeat-associated protein